MCLDEIGRYDYCAVCDTPMCDECMRNVECPGMPSDSDTDDDLGSVGSDEQVDIPRVVIRVGARRVVAD